ncbi:integrator complex subunit 1-like isoform X1 [Amphibalanus amphitrite]|uniref:integrator complex subunit 1-like isoform X1 n=1 Tax=Amphibalanus amphitrite TaxID=1232801 RepID=UPI001C9014B0|nr:integrator complex subunit 1-like isoform X1 [Amphibalanus amphitrite]
MERNKHGGGPPKRGGKVKSMAPLHGDLIALGAKGSSRMDMDSKHQPPAQMKPTTMLLSKPEKKMEAGGSGMLKKPKSQLGMPSSVRPVDRQASRPETEAWLAAAVELPPSADLVAAVAEADFLRAEGLLCGAVRQLHAQRAKPDPALTLSLLLVAKTQPAAFCTETALAAVCSLLRRDAAASFKSKGNPQVQVLAANLLYWVFRDEPHWKEMFVRVYLDDAAGDRLWVDSEECRPFVENVLTAFGTRLAPKSMLQPDVTLAGRPDCPSPPGAASSSSSMQGNDDDDSLGISIVLDDKSGHTVKPRYETQGERVRALVLDAVKEYIGPRKQPIETVTRNILRLLASVCGIPEVRQRVVSRLEVWLQNPKWSRPAQELLVSLCSNLTAHTQFDVDVISQLVKFRIKAKPIVNLYLSCMRELLAAHPDNMATLLKHTIYNELSQTRNPHNMAVLSAVFQHSGHQAAGVLADVFLELLMNKEDYYLRVLRPLWREICRSLRYEVDFLKFCSGLFQERKDAAFREFEFRERYVNSVCDLVSLSILLAITGPVKEAATTRPGESRNTAPLTAYQKMVSLIQREAAQWLHTAVPDMVVKNWPEFPHCVYKVLFMEPAEAYHKHDNWPPEVERALMIRIASEVPVLQDTLLRVLLIGLSKTHPMPAANALEVAENLVKRSALCHLHTESGTTTGGLQLDKLEMVDLLFNLTVYHQPEHMALPEGYMPPQLAIQERYWRVWTILLVVSAHNPTNFGKVAWEHYPTLKMLMEMCITNSFRFPPPTMVSPDRADDPLASELQLAAMEGRQILEYESHLAAASTGQTITESNSLLLTQLITLDPTGPCRRPPAAVLEQLSQLNAQLRLGQLLCTSREPEFLLDILQRQGPNQSMPWLSDLVENNEGAFSVLPVQCLCEFLLTQTVGAVDDLGVGRPPAPARHHQLLSHLQRLVRHPGHDQRANFELVEYFLRRLSSQQRQARLQAAKGFELVLQPPDAPPADPREPYSWLLRHLPAVPNFPHLRQGAIQGLRIACHYETEPGLVGAYIQFLAAHGSGDPLPELAETVVDLAQLLVERSTIVTALLPAEPGRPDADYVTLRALLHIFNTYMQLVTGPSAGAGYDRSEAGDVVVVCWPSGRKATINTLVVQATVILLTHHPGAERHLFDQLLELWFPAAGPAPRALDSEAALFQDWLKLRMIRSSTARLVDAALAGLEPAQLLLFIQSFGVPVASMTKLLLALDAAVAADPAAVTGAVLNREFMAQLVEVQHQRGARGGHQFAAILGTDAEKKSPEPVLEPPSPTRPPPVAVSRPLTALAPSQVLWFVRELFSDQPEATHQHQLRSLQRCISMEAREVGRLVTKATISALLQLLREGGGAAFLSQLHRRPTVACCLLRLLTAVVRPDSSLSADLTAVCEAIGSGSPPPPPGPLASICEAYLRRQRRTTASELAPPPGQLTRHQLTQLLSGTAPSRAESTVRRLVDRCLAADRTPHLVAAISHCLLQHNAAGGRAGLKRTHDQADRSPGDAAGDGAPAGLSPGQVGLLVDWLELLEPEVISSCPDTQLQMLFSSSGGGGGGGQPGNRAYLLALLTHHASWATLHTTIDVLLGTDCDKYDPTVVLDFLWACLFVPRLWQGQDKSVSPRQESADMLRLSADQMVSLVRHVVREQAGAAAPVDVSARLPLLLRCCRRRPPLVAAAVSHLEQTRAGGGPRAAAAGRLLLELYLQLPHVIALLDGGGELLESAPLDGGVSVLDALSHTLLTSIGATRPGKEWITQMRDFEISLRKMAATHPMLLLRQLPMVASLLRGRTHLDGPVFRQRNHAVLFAKLLGVLELLQPQVYLSHHRAALLDILDSYCHMLQRQNLKEVTAMVPRIAVILNNFLSRAPAEASQFLHKYSELIMSLASRFPDQPLLRTLASYVTSAGGGGGPPPLSTGADAAPSPAQLAGLMMKLNSAESSDELAAVLQDLDTLAARRVGVLDKFVDNLCDLLSSCGAPVRELAHSLLLRYLQQTPAAADRCVSAYFECLDSGDECVRAMVLDRLPEIVVLAQEHASQLMQKAFDVAIATNIGTASYISDAMALLNVQTGA